MRSMRDCVISSGVDWRLKNTYVRCVCVVYVCGALLTLYYIIIHHSVWFGCYYESLNFAHNFNGRRYKHTYIPTIEWVVATVAAAAAASQMRHTTHTTTFGVGTDWTFPSSRRNTGIHTRTHAHTWTHFILECCDNDVRLAVVIMCRI